MDNSLGSAIKKIKHNELGKEAQLIEKRENENTIALLNRAVRETAAQFLKLQEEEELLIQETNKLRAELEIKKILQKAFIMQIEAFNNELAKLRIICDQGITEVWKLRSSLCDTIQNISDVCDVWALFMKPVLINTCSPLSGLHYNTEELFLNDQRLKMAIQRREKALNERERLQNEPETGEEFVRIRNAVRYSSEMVANLRKIHQEK